jgi:hypothetical protein
MQTRVLKPDERQRILASPEIRQKWKGEVWLDSIGEEEALRIFQERATWQERGNAAPRRPPQGKAADAARASARPCPGRRWARPWGG